MNVASAIRFEAPAASVPRPDNSEPKADDASNADSATSPKFAALMALLANSGARVRPELLRKASPGDMALLDRLLNGVLAGNDPKTTEAGESGTALTDAGRNATASTNAALEAVRYGMLNDLANGVLSTLPVPNTNENGAPTAHDLATASKTKPVKAFAKKEAGEERLQGLARALQSVKAPTRGLIRAADVHGTSIEELMALGDRDGAGVKSMLDSLLSKAGTPEGMQLADLGTAAMTNATSTEMAAFAAALAAARIASAADTSTPVTDMSALQPDLRAKLDRVIARMQSEFGHDVNVVETARSPERQAQLYAQGRTTPGDVVTWTLESAHLNGAAVDVVVDGSWTNAEGFARLQRIAREEGLRTLGAKDPGHLELMNAGELADTPLPTTATTRNTGSTGNGNGATMAGIARVAGVASVAQVGNVSRTEDSVPDRAERATVGAAVSALTEGGARGREMSSFAGRDGARDEARDAARDSVRNAARDARASSEHGGAFPAYGDAQNATVTRNPSGLAVDRSAPAAGLGAAQRVADAMDRRDDAPARALSQMTLEVEGPGGDAQRITVDMRGNAVSTRIDTDAMSADRLRARVGELQGALEQHGLQSEVIRITSPAARTVDAAEQVKQAAVASERDALRLAGANGSNAGDGVFQQGLRDRPGAARDWEKHNDARNARDEQRQGNSQRNRRGPNYEEL